MQEHDLDRKGCKNETGYKSESEAAHPFQNNRCHMFLYFGDLLGINALNNQCFKLNILILFLNFMFEYYLFF